MSNRITLSQEFPGMNRRHINLMRKAVEKSRAEGHDQIFMPESCTSLKQCFKWVRKGQLSFWYDKPVHGSTSRTTSCVLEGCN